MTDKPRTSLTFRHSDREIAALTIIELAVDKLIHREEPEWLIQCETPRGANALRALLYRTVKPYRDTSENKVDPPGEFIPLFLDNITISTPKKGESQLCFRKTSLGTELLAILQAEGVDLNVLDSGNQAKQSYERMQALLEAEAEAKTETETETETNNER